jgi:enoyl-CoA hydratase/3-hydroxyacyl-CoA dehydrogenase
MFVRRAAVVGAGTMGGQIAQVIAAAGLPVLLRDIDGAALESGLAEARRVSEAQLARLVAAGKLSEHAAAEQVEQLLARITAVDDWSGFGEVDVVVEAVPERLEVKQEVFAALDACVGGQALLASNTSALSITQLGEATLRPERVVGLHFFYPASLMPLVEIVEGEETSQETLTDAVAFVQQIRKQPIRCLEVPGFVVNRILNSVTSEVWQAQERGGLSIAAIDEGLVAAGAVPVGPYRLVDLLGLDTVLHVAEHLADSYGEERFHVPESMQRLVANGKLGAKRGGDGFYHPDGSAAVAGEATPDIDALAEQVRLKAIVEACLLLEEDVAGVREIDLGMMAGAGLEPGRGLLPPFMQADSDGLDRVIERLEDASERFGERFEPPAILRRLVAQGRLGRAGGQGFYAYPRPDEGPQPETVKFETADETVAIAWLQAGAMNAISAQVIEDLTVAYERAEAAGMRALVIASANPMLFSAGADIKGFAAMDRWRRSPPSTRSPSAAAASWRWPATCGSRRARRCSGSPRSSSGSSPASAEPNACLGSSASRRPSR